MKKKLIICYGFDFEKSRNANALCLHNLLVPIKDKADFTIFTDGDEENSLCANSIKVFRFYTGNSGGTKKKVCIFTNIVEKKFEDWYKEEQWDTIITVSFPFQIAEIGYKIKKAFKKIKLISYFLDPYAANSALKYNKILYPYRYLKELRVINCSNMVYVAEDLKPVYESFSAFEKNIKILALPIPMLKIRDQVDVSAPINNVIKMVFAGSLDKEFRNPTGLLKFLKLAEEKSKFNFQIVFYSNINDVFPESVINSFKYGIELNNFVSKSKLEKILSQCHILINIGNKGLDHSLPSKVIDYIGFRKPILNYAFKENDLGTKFLENYPLKFSVLDNDLSEETIGMFQDFLNSEVTKVVTKSDLKALYKNYLIENIAECFLKYI